VITSTISSPSGQSSRAHLVVVRGLVWGLVGLLYAPLFLGLLTISRELGLGHAAFIPAAALASAGGAIFYGARQVAITGTVVGVILSAVLILAIPQSLGLWCVAGLATLAGAGVGWWVDFPDRCSLQVPAKSIAGLITGALCGCLLTSVEPFHPFSFGAAGALAFLVSANGVLYVAVVPWCVRLTVRNGRRHCNIVEAGVVALLAGTVAGGLWLAAAPLLHLAETSLSLAMVSRGNDLPAALFGGVLGGAVGGVLLEVFGFRWVHDV
jgi:hypothetical protein